jgi:aspartate aminotransferase-like enzyme
MLFIFACEAAGASCAQHSLRPLKLRGQDIRAKLARNARRECEVVSRRHCEEPTGRANARPMTGSATKQSILSLRCAMDCFASIAMTIDQLKSWLFEN